MIYVKNTARTAEKAIARVTLEQLRMLMDWQLRELGYDPQSVNEACRRVDEREGR